MDRHTVLGLFDRQMRREARPDGPGSRVERVGDVVRQVGPAHGWNGVLWSGLDRLDTAGVEGVIAGQVAYFTSCGRAFEWKLYAHDRPGDLPDRLEAAGFRPEPEEALMAAEIAGLHGTVIGTEPPEGIEVRAVTDEAGVELVTEVHERAFDTDGAGLRRRLLDQLAARPGTVAAVVAMAGDRPVSSARLELPPGTAFAGLWGGGTVREWRGRGIYRALVAHRARLAAERGYRYLQVDASDQSRPILSGLGFTRLSATTPYVYEP
ncbi:GNAT family N-acetyltransferase [Streptomyces sp. CB03238]|uniref:GNAT family N-acetyltransferase n=1 Tax=Streptomyces sp. CB03238 TaxID=1907777 RepID=UPI000A11209E|nr:GNAT family N-acetyltransferase [Streptomyces sp. CB03238]ORT54118.1 GNAT family N-acetyltransferase [Streptomyces sp. CB03238]